MTEKSFPTADYADIRQNLKEFLESKDVLKEFDFEGSAAKVLIDTLAYNTHINTFYANMVGNESFLTSAVLRDSVVAKANSLGYYPRSVSSARAILNLTLSSSSTDTFIIVPADTVFKARSADKVFSFRTYEAFTAVKISEGVYKAENVVIYEGKKFQHQYLVDGVDIVNSVLIPNANVDTSILRVFVSRPEAPQLFDEYKLNSDITLTDGDSFSYYLEEVEGGRTRVTFGDDILSKKLNVGQTVKIDYITSKGTEANGIKVFTLESSIPTVSNVTLEILSAAAGGSEAESINEIKFNAPRAFEVQNRAVTANDYSQIVKRIFPNADDVISRGGEELIPPLYNKIAIVIKPKTGRFLSNSEKANLISGIKQFAVLLSEPVILDPEYLYLNIFAKIDYDTLKTSQLEEDFRNSLKNKIKSFSDTFLSSFSKDLRVSFFYRFIDDSDPAVISNITDIQVEKRIFVQTDRRRDYNFTFSTEVKPTTFFSSAFTYNGISNCFFSDTTSGKLSILSTGSNAQTDILLLDAGTINYSTGEVYINPVIIQELILTDEFFDFDLSKYFVKFFAQTTGKNINLKKEQILVISDVDVQLSKVTGYK